MRVDAPNGSLHETVKDNDVKGDHLIAEDDSKDSHEKAEDLAFHCEIAGDNRVDQSISGEKATTSFCSTYSWKILLLSWSLRQITRDNPRSKHQE